MTETFHGYIETTQDVLLVFEGCRRGLLPRVRRRLQEKERKTIQSGSVFVFDERESGIKRWTDGFIWSPSRILGNFLIYRELDKRSTDKKLSLSSISGTDARQRSYSADQTSSSSAAAAAAAAAADMTADRNRERRLVGSLSDSYKFRKDGLVKKTMAIVVNGVSQHLISYYNPEDIIQSKLRTPSSVPDLAGLEISPDLLVKHNFRIPPVVEPAFDESDQMQASHYPHEYGDRRMNPNPLRSMSVGSVRTSEHFQNTVMPRQDMMYSSPYGQTQQRMDIDGPQKHSPPTMPYGNQPMSIMYTGGYPTGIPSPTAMMCLCIIRTATSANSLSTIPLLLPPPPHLPRFTPI
ncbi:Gti1/Pac2 family-domain-containing protein [Phycomyces nitens]|nr:Gti1/Pac2 family-domain-containing protein [Phycomyces nitens]